MPTTFQSSINSEDSNLTQNLHETVESLSKKSSLQV